MNSSAKNASDGLAAPARPAPLEVDVNTSLASIASGGKDIDANNDVNNLSVLSKASYVSHRGFVPPERVTGWVNIVFIIISDLVGTGIVGLPYTFAKLGWAVGATVLLLFGLLTVYAGLLLWRLHMTYPNGITMGNIAESVSGKALMWFVFVIVYAHFFFKMSSYLLTAAKSVQTMLWMYDVCLYWASVGAIVFFFPICQLRTLHHISFVGVVSVTTIVIVMIILISQSFATWDMRGIEGVVTNPLPTGTGYEGFVSGLSAMTSLVFAYGGQGMYLESMSEMRNPKDFPKALYTFSSVIIFLYMSTSLMLYFRYGENSAGNILFSMNNGALKTVASTLMFLHVCVSFCLNAQLLTRALHVRLFPYSVNKGGAREALPWFGITCGTLSLAWLVGNAIPFFSDLNGIISSLCVGPTTFGFPALFYLLACRRNEKKVPWYELLVCSLMILIAVFFVLVGTSVDFVQIANDVKELGAPFSCILVSN